MKNNACSFTGHRVIAAAKKESITEDLKKAVCALIDEGITDFISGGALGFDTMVANLILELKEKYPHIRLVLFLPCPEQDKLWKDKDKAVYKDIVSRADEVKYTSDSYTDGCMLKRNREMVDNSSICIAYYDGRPRSGTAMTVSYAKKSGIRVINLF